MGLITAACLSSLVTLSTTGGFGGGGTGEAARFRTGDLPPDLQAELCATFDPERLQVWDDMDVVPPDAFVYEVLIDRSGAPPVAFAISEAGLPADARALFQRLARLHPRDVVAPAGSDRKRR